MIHTVSKTPFRDGAVFKTFLLPGGTVIKVLNRAVFDRALAAASKKMREIIDKNGRKNG